jgi:hypothetical protein
MPEAGPGDPKPLARLLGEAAGHVIAAIRTPVGRVRVARRSESAEVGELVLHRTVIDEVEPRSSAGSASREGGPARSD